MLLRLQTMVMMAYEMPVLAIRQQIAAAIDVIIHVGRLRDGSRKILEICEVTGMKEGEIMITPIYKFKEYGEKDNRIVGQLEKIGSLKNIQKLRNSGWKDVCM